MQERISFGKLLRKYRVRKGLTQAALAEIAGLSPRAIGSIERGEQTRCFPHTISALANALDLSAEDSKDFHDSFSLDSPTPTMDLLDVDASLELGKICMRQGRWTEAAQHFDAYASRRQMTWEEQYWRGGAHGMSRRGSASDRVALLAYTESIKLARDIDKNTRARLYTHRGAMYKRLGLLKEAEADLLVAQGLAGHGVDINDINYNLACVYAMKGDRPRLFEMLERLKESPDGYRQIISRLGGYFKSYAHDDEFLRVIGLHEAQSTGGGGHGAVVVGDAEGIRQAGSSV